MGRVITARLTASSKRLWVLSLCLSEAFRLCQTSVWVSGVEFPEPFCDMRFACFGVRHGCVPSQPLSYQNFV